MRRRLLGGFVLAAALAACVPAHGQDYPSKPVKFVVPFPPGGGADRLARAVAERLWKKWGQPVIVENRAGAGANIGAEAVFRAAPDGYTVLFGTPGPIVINKLLYTKLNYDSDAFTPISWLTLSPNMLVVHPSVPAKSIREFIALAKARPGQLNYGSTGVGTTPHLTGELFNSAADVKIVHVPYKGSTIVLTDLMGGRVDMSFFLLGNVIAQIRAGKLRALAVTSAKRSALLPAVPALSEVLPGFVSIQWIAAAAPPGTPPAVVNKLNAGITEVMKQPDVVKQLNDLGDEAVGSTPAEMAALVKREKALWGKVIRVSGATAEE
jgi:tripartite-type tricarboxylate transporter receptor subunit TctC